MKSWFLVTNGDDIVWQAIGGSDRSGLRRRDGVFGFYKWMVSHGVPSAASTYPDCYNLLLWRSFALVCHMLLCCFLSLSSCNVMSSSSVLLMLYSKAAPVWVLAAFSLGSLSLGMLFIRQLMY